MQSTVIMSHCDKLLVTSFIQDMTNKIQPKIKCKCKVKTII